MMFRMSWLARRFDVLPYPPPARTKRSPIPVGDRCWLCGDPITDDPWHRDEAFGETFTNVTRAAEPSSSTVCQACAALGGGTAWKTYVERNPDLGLKCVHPLSWRTYSHAVYDASTPEHPSRSRWRELLIDPPEPPFVFVVAISGQKHLLFRTRIGWDRETFPVLVEEDELWIRRGAFTALLGVVEALLAQGWSRDEVETGRWSPGRKIDLAEWRKLADDVDRYRSMEPGWVRLACRVALRPARDEEAA
jgi:hypothetical protein